jgi:RNA polymerase sigma-70 factor (ECF subfamily)
MQQSTSSPSPFAPTQWSVVLAAQDSDPEQARSALEALCTGYWRPLYSFVRRRGYSRWEAQDLVQGFFASLLQDGMRMDVHPDRGRFRTYLLACLKHFLADERRRQGAAKRGGGVPHLSMDADEAEAFGGLEPVDNRTADRLYDRHWALCLLDTVLGELEHEYRDAGKDALFAALQPVLTDPAARIGYAEVGAGLGMSEGAVKVAAHRLRRRYRDLLREEISRTVDRREDVDRELRELIEALGNAG